MLSSFYYGYVLTHLPGGVVADRFGGKHALGVGLLATSITTLLSPLAARLGVGYLIAIRVLMGLGEVGGGVLTTSGARLLLVSFCVTGSAFPGSHVPRHQRAVVQVDTAQRAQLRVRLRARRYGTGCALTVSAGSSKFSNMSRHQHLCEVGGFLKWECGETGA